MMNRDQWLRERHLRGGTWQAAAIVYALIVATMVLSAMAIL